MGGKKKRKKERKNPPHKHTDTQTQTDRKGNKFDESLQTDIKSTFNIEQR